MTDWRTQLLDYVAQGHAAPPPGLPVWYDRDTDRYFIRPTGRRKVVRQVEGAAYRRIADFHRHSSELLAEQLGRVELPSPKPIPKTPGGDHICVTTIHDLHVGALANEYSSGFESNLELTRSNLGRVLYRNLEQIQRYGLPEAWVMGLFGDWCHFDSSRYATTRGTPQDPAADYATTVREAIQLAVDTIETLRAFAPIYCYFGGGNHAYNTETALYAALTAMYAGADDVRFADNVHPYQFHLYGSSAIMMHHGHQPKVDQVDIFDSNAPPAASRAKYRYILHGHMHHLHAREKRGTIIYQSPSIAQTDAYHAGAGYTDARRQISWLCIDKRHGMTATFQAGVDE